MNNYIIDRETLGQLVDDLMKKGPLSASNAEELNTLREKTMEDLDNKINMAIFESLPTEKLLELEHLMDDINTPPEVFQKFFQESGINLQKIIKDTFDNFTKEFLGGQNE